MPLPDNPDCEKPTDVALAILWLAAHDDSGCPRVWKGLDWDLMKLLHQKE